MRKNTLSTKLKVEKSSGNIFADLGLPNPEEALLKASLALKIEESIRRKKITQVKAAEILGIDQPKVSAIIRGDLNRFSTDRLLRFLRLLGNDVDIIVKPNIRSRSPGKFLVRDQ